MNSLISLLNFPNVLYSRFQSHTYPFVYNPTDKDLNKIEEFSKFDIKIYNRAFSKKKLFSKSLINPSIKRKNNYFLLSSPLISNDKEGVYLFNEDQYKNIIQKFHLTDKILYT